MLFDRSFNQLYNNDNVNEQKITLVMLIKSVMFARYGKIAIILKKKTSLFTILQQKPFHVYQSH